MDDETLAPEVFAAVITDLAQVNTFTLARRPTLAWLEQTTRGLKEPLGMPAQPDAAVSAFTLLDVGFGHGDMLRAIARWSRRRGLSARLFGVDRNPRSAPVAAAATDPALGITYLTGEAAALDLTPDFIISSLVAHHMTHDELVGFLRWMESTARRGWFVNDLHRHRGAFLGFRLLARAMRWHPIVRHDGALSVRRAFVRSDWHALLAEAGLANQPIDVHWHLPFRWGVGRVR